MQMCRKEGFLRVGTQARAQGTDHDKLEQIAVLRSGCSVQATRHSPIASAQLHADDGLRDALLDTGSGVHEPEQRTAVGQDVEVLQDAADERQQDGNGDAGGQHDDRHQPVGQVLLGASQLQN